MLRSLRLACSSKTRLLVSCELVLFNELLSRCFWITDNFRSLRSLRLLSTDAALLNK